MNEGRVQYALILHFFSSRVLHIPWPGMSLIELRDLIIAVSPRLQKSYKNKIGNKSDYPRPKDTQTRPNNQITEE